MVEWEGLQVSPLRVRPQQTMSSGDINKAYDLGSGVAEQWLTSGVAQSNFQQEADSLCNSVLNSDQGQISFSLDETTKLKNDEEKIPIQTSVSNVQNPSLLNLIISNNLCEPWEMNTDINGPSDKNQDYFIDNRNPLPMWGFPMDVDSLKIDDVFQVDKADLFQGPTLAELNANDESLFDSLDIFDLCLPTENKYITPYKAPKAHTVTLASKTLPDYSECSMKISYGNMKHAKEISAIKTEPILPAIEDKMYFSEKAIVAENVPEVAMKPSTSAELSCDLSQTKELTRRALEAKLQTVPTCPSSPPAISASKPLATVVKKEPDDESLLSDLQAKEKIIDRHLSESDNPSNLSTFSNDEGFDSQGEISDNDYVFSSDAESADDITDDLSSNWSHSVDKWAGNKKKTRYFWQYNIQAKGPKGPKLKLATHFANPHSLTNVTDPVFSTACRIEGIKHSGKARRGDGNDLTPNPRKLFSIGVELQKLSSVINDLKPVNELPFYARPKSRKEKNKLASRVCRLKKKAQHEANKLKFFGLQKEHRQLLNVLQEVKKIFKGKLRNMRLSQEESCHKKMENLFAKCTCIRVAGCSAEFVNGVLDKVASGDPCGGLNKM